MNDNHSPEYFGIYDKELNKVVSNNWKVLGKLRPAGHELLFLQLLLLRW